MFIPGTVPFHSGLPDFPSTNHKPRAVRLSCHASMSCIPAYTCTWYCLYVVCSLSFNSTGSSVPLLLLVPGMVASILNMNPLYVCIEHAKCIIFLNFIFLLSSRSSTWNLQTCKSPNLHTSHFSLPELYATYPCCADRNKRSHLCWPLTL